ncbi:alpha/beta fold hydrolase [Colwelliaceae bacterium BS250]
MNDDFLKGVYLSGAGETVVLLHSSLSSSRQWQTLVSKLESNYQCINIDLLGYGQAPKVCDAEHYSLTTETQRVLAVVNHYIGNKPFHLVGHSFGGANALKIAVEHSARLLSVNLFEPVALHLLEPGSQMRQQVDEFSLNVAGLANNDAAQYFTDTWNRPGFFQQLPSKIQRLMANDIDKVKLDFIGLFGETYEVQNCDVIKCPVNIMHGSKSPVFTRTIIDKLVAVLPNVFEREIKAGHMAPISHSEQVATMINDFIRNISSFN